MPEYLCGLACRANVMFAAADGRRVVFDSGVFLQLDGKEVPIWLNHTQPVGHGVLQATAESLRFRMLLTDSPEHRRLRQEIVAGHFGGASAAFNGQALDCRDSLGGYDRVTHGFSVRECGPVQRPCCTGTAVWIEQGAPIAEAAAIGKPRARKRLQIRIPAPPACMLQAQAVLRGDADGMLVNGRWISAEVVRATMRGSGLHGIW